ncbi:MAG: hypothetical protein OEY59_12365, partial [Deltaproteobacteria bacterium]|nr:hypothetical protein [Deltaproteobacteria bacterium]
VFSNTHNLEGENQVDRKPGEINVEISSFSPITEVLVNGEPATIQKDALETQLRILYHITDGDKKYSLVVKTAEESITKEFSLSGKKRPGKKKEKSPFGVISMLGYSAVDNVTNSSNEANKLADSKLSLTLVPRYDLKTASNSSLIFKAILLSEKYSDSQFSENEIVFYQLATDWVLKSGFGGVKLGLGYNDIKNKSAGIVAGENEVEKDLFLAGSISPKVLSGLDLGLKMTQKTLPGQTNEDENGNGTLVTFSAGWKMALSSLKFGFNFGYDNNDAIGKYMDFKATRLKISLKYGVSRNFSLGVNSIDRQTTFKLAKLAGKEAESSRTSTLSLKGDYTLSKKSGLTLMGEYKQKAQTSNDPTKEFQTSTQSLSLMYPF